jgi:hypothetical protein
MTERSSHLSAMPSRELMSMLSVMGRRFWKGRSYGSPGCSGEFCDPNNGVPHTMATGRVQWFVFLCDVSLAFRRVRPASTTTLAQ